MTSVDCEKLKQLRDDAYTQVVLVQIEAKDQSARKGFLGIFKSSEKDAKTKGESSSAEDQDIQARLEAANKKYQDAKENYEKNCKGK
jgi:hypothetical protein